MAFKWFLLQSEMSIIFYTGKVYWGGFFVYSSSSVNKLLNKAFSFFFPQRHARIWPPSQRTGVSYFLLQEDRVSRLKDEGSTMDLAYVDFVKAFKSFNHQFLQAKLKTISHRWKWTELYWIVTWRSIIPGQNRWRSFWWAGLPKWRLQGFRYYCFCHT